MAGIAYSTLREWEKAFPEFSEALELAEGVAEDRHIGILETAASGWVEVTVTTVSGEEGTTETIKRQRRFLPQYSALYLRTRRPQDHAPNRPLSEEEDAGGKLADTLADIARSMLAASQQEALDAEFSDLDA